MSTNLEQRAGRRTGEPTAATRPQTRPDTTAGTLARSAANPRTVLVGIWLGALATVALWWQNTPSVSGLGEWLTNAGRITGLLAGYAVVVLVGLMARVPGLERGVGSDRLARWHSMGGRYTVSLVVAHGVLITWGYAVLAHAGLLQQGWALLMNYPDVLAATVAGLLFVGVGIVSARAARRRMRYETWYYLHFYTYLAVALAFSHQFATGAEFVRSPLARVLWAAMYIGVGLLVLWHRVLTPVRQARRHRLRVVDVVTEAPGVVSVLVGGAHLDELGAEPGQFFRWRFLTRDLWWATNPYSLSAPVSPRLLRITIKNLGDHSAALAGLRPGTRVVAEGPYGAFTGRRRTRQRVLLIAGGVGITPVRALFESLPADHGEITLLYRASRPEHLLFRRELETIAAARRAPLHFLVGSRAELGRDPLSAQALAAIVPGLRGNDVYVSGPEQMTRAVTKALCAAGVPQRHIHSESFTF